MRGFNRLAELHKRVVHVEKQDASLSDQLLEDKLMSRLSPSLWASLCPGCYAEVDKKDKDKKSI